MHTIKLVLESILHGRYDFCCICLNIIEGDKCYNIQDEIVFHNKDAKNLLEILSYVTASEINSLSEFLTICHMCTEKAIQAYKFVAECREKSLQLGLAVKVLHNYFENKTEQIISNNCLFVCLDSEYGIKDYTLNREEDKTPCEILNMLQRLPKIEQNIRIEMEEVSETDGNFMNENLKKICHKVDLIDIIYDKNNLSLYKCKVCHNTFSRAPNLKKHYYSMHAPKLHRCSLCPKSFGSSILLKTHQDHHHCDPVCCTVCGKVYSSVYALQTHEERHKKLYTCQHCGKVYKTKLAFKNHVNKFHYGVLKHSENFICDYCGKKYCQKSAIRVHIQFEHGNGKYYECDWCRKKFSSVSRLKEHIITHTKEKRFNCGICDGRFATKMSLLYHTRIHTGERPYQCEHCDSSFLSMSRKMTHIKQHHLPAVQECDVCHKKFKQRAHLLRHRNKHFDPSSKLHSSVQV